MADDSVRAVEQRLSQLERDRNNALVRAREIAESVADGRRTDDAQSEADYSAAKRDIETLGNRIQETRWDLEAAREAESKRDALAATLSRTGFGESTVSAADTAEARYGRPLPKGAGFVDLAPQSRTAEEAGEYIRALLRDDVSVRSTMTEGTPTSGGYLVPTAYSAPLLDLARAKARLVEAGARVVPIESSEQKVARHDGDVTFQFRSEAAAVSESGTTIGNVTLTPRSMSTLVRVSLELLDDASVDVESYLADVLAAAAAVKVDSVGLYGSGVSPEPRGIRNTSGVTITPLATNGADLADFDPIVDLVGRVKTANYDPTAIIYSPRTESSTAKFRAGGTGAYLAPPAYLSRIPMLATSNVKSDQTQGTGTNAADVFAGDFTKALIGIRHDLRILPMRESFLGTGEVGFAAFLRVDVAVARTDAIQVLSGVLN